MTTPHGRVYTRHESGMPDGGMVCGFCGAKGTYLLGHQGISVWVGRKDCPVTYVMRNVVHDVTPEPTAGELAIEALRLLEKHGLCILMDKIPDDDLATVKEEHVREWGLGVLLAQKALMLADKEASERNGESRGHTPTGD